MIHELNLVNKLNDIQYTTENGTYHFWNDEKKNLSFVIIDWLKMRNLDDVKLEYNHCSVDDVLDNPTKKYYFFYYSSLIDFGEFSDKLSSNDSELKELIELFKMDNVKIVFMDPHESVGYHFLNKFSSSIKKLGINRDKILYVNNDVLLPEQSKDLNFIGKKWNHLFVNTSYGYLEDSDDVQYMVDREFVFLSKNKRIKPHRTLILGFLKKYDLLKKTNYSYLGEIDNFSDIDDYLQFYNFDKSVIDTFRKDINDIMEWKPIHTKYEGNKWINYNIEDINFAGEHVVHDYESAYINITTESNFLKNDNNKFIHISEKSLKPFAMYQLPLIVSSPHHIKNMKNLYGLDFFDDFINHSYDNEENDSKRILLIKDEIIRLSKLENELSEYFEKNKQRFLNNRKIIENISKWKETNLLNFILNM